MVEAREMSKKDLHEFTSWMTAKNWARRKLKKTGHRQAIYFVMKGESRIYKYMPYDAWKVMKPGKLAFVMQNPDPMFNGVFGKKGKVRCTG